MNCQYTPSGPNIARHTATHLVKVDDWLPESVLHLVEVAHTDFTEVTRMVLVHVCAVVVLTTSKTTTTGMLSVLAYTTVTGRDVTAAVKKDMLVYHSRRNLQMPFPCA